METTLTARHALSAYEQRSRSRILTAITERIADGMFAAGGILLADATFPLHLGLPQGRVGLSLGGALVAGALAWMKRHAGGRRPHARRVATPATQLAPVIVMRRAA